MRISDFEVSKFGGLLTAIKDKKTIKPGIATDANNWATAKFGDSIELRRGMALLGSLIAVGTIVRLFVFLPISKRRTFGSFGFAVSMRRMPSGVSQ